MRRQEHVKGDRPVKQRAQLLRRLCPRTRPHQLSEDVYKRQALDQKARELEQQIHQEAGYEFNINSPKQLGDALFVKLGLPHGKKTKTGYSTNADVLEGLRFEHPVVDMVLNYRTLTKLKSTYCDLSLIHI